MTTQQSGFMGPGGAESSQVLVKSLVKVAFRGELLFRPLRPDSIETDVYHGDQVPEGKKIVPAS